MTEKKVAFSAGELDPELWGRSDLDQFEIGAAFLTNMTVNYGGGARKRDGMELVALVSTVEIPPPPAVQVCVIEHIEYPILATSSGEELAASENTAYVIAATSSGEELASSENTGYAIVGVSSGEELASSENTGYALVSRTEGVGVKQNLAYIVFTEGVGA